MCHTTHRSGRARSPKRETRLEPRETGYMCAPERGFAEEIWRAIRLSHLRFISKLLDTGGYDRRFHTRLENLRSGSTSISGFPTGTEALLVVVDRTQQSGAASLIAQSRLLCLVHVLLHVLKAWALLVY